MASQRFLVITAVCLSSMGCMGVRHFFLTNVHEPRQFCIDREREVTFERNWELARRAWARVVREDPEACGSKDYRAGFLDGYADYLNLGGTGASPPIPPRQYWNADYKNPAGQEAIHDWYAGFEHGSAEARQSGCRELEVVPASVALPLEACSVATAGGDLSGSPEIFAPAPMPEFVPAPLPEPLANPPVQTLSTGSKDSRDDG